MRRLLSKNRIAIDLVEPVVYLRGLQEEATHTTIRGAVKVNLKDSAVIRSISLRLLGNSLTTWDEDGPSGVNGQPKRYESYKSFVNSVIPIYQASEVESQQPLALSSGQHRYPFEICLPNSLPESVDMSEAKVSYKLIATLEDEKRPNNNVIPEFLKSSQDTAETAIQLVRLPSDADLTNDSTGESMTSHHHHPNLCDFDITIEKTAVSPGSLLPISLQVTPLMKGVRIEQIHSRLKERCDLKIPEQQAKRTSEKNHFLEQKGPSKHAVNADLDTLGGHWDGRIVFAIPESQSRPKLHHSTIAHPEISVQHWLQLSVWVSCPEPGTKNKRMRKSLVFDTKINVLNKCVAGHANEDCVALPIYQEAVRDISISKNQTLNRHMNGGYCAYQLVEPNKPTPQSFVNQNTGSLLPPPDYHEITEAPQVSV
ncbi:hypothetical protein VKS41_003329 [Umbelopsis sp. WA50703]